MKQLVLDAGPLIGLFFAKDTYHKECVAGFAQLSQQQKILLTPVPIIFEVYKWLLQRTRPEIAQNALKIMQSSLHPIALEQDDFDELQGMVLELTQWQGSLEDGTVLLMALKYRCPVWTYNFRDFGIFKTLEFWNPAPPTA